MVGILTTILDVVFIIFAIYGIVVFRKWHKVAFETDVVLEELKKDIEDNKEEMVRCESCLYRSQYANKEGLYRCGGIQCEEGHCILVTPNFSCIGGVRRDGE